MRHRFCVTLLLMWSLGVVHVASAQEAAPAAPGAATPSTGIAMAPANLPQQRLWLEQDLNDAEDRSRRIRNALIGTSAAFALGAILGGIGASQCQVVSTPGQNDEYRCNNAGDVLVPLGGTIAALGAVGMITSGIMLGVANKRKREIKRDLRRTY